jgi:hypothetical protein
MYVPESLNLDPSSCAVTPAEDVLLALDPAMGSYLLVLLMDALRYRAGGWETEWHERVTGFAMYLHDALPEALRTSVPPLTQVARVRGVSPTL